MKRILLTTIIIGTTLLMCGCTNIFKPQPVSSVPATVTSEEPTASTVSEDVTAVSPTETSASIDDPIQTPDEPDSTYIPTAGEMISRRFECRDADDFYKAVMFYVVNDKLYMEYDSEAEAYWAGEVILDSIDELSICEENGATLSGIIYRFSSFSMAGEYWDGGVPIGITYDYKDQIFVKVGNEFTFMGQASDDPVAIHATAEELKEQIESSGPYVLPCETDTNDNTVVCGKWESYVYNEEGTSVYLFLEFGSNGEFTMIRKDDGAPVTMYLGAYGICEDGGNAVLVCCEQLGYAQTPYDTIFTVDLESDTILQVGTHDAANFDLFEGLDIPITFDWLS